MSPASRQTWRPDREDVKRSIIEVGLSMLAAEGVAMGADRLSLERAAAGAKVSRAAAYKLWKGLDLRPQEAFQLDVLCHAAETLAAGEDIELERTMHAVADVLASVGPIEQLDDDRRREAFVRLVRTGAEENIRLLRASRHWNVYLAILAGTASRTRGGAADDSDPLTAAMRRGARRATLRYRPMYHEMASLFGQRLRAGYTLAQFATAAGCLAEGIAVRMPFSDEIEGVEGPYGLPGPWHLFAVALLALTREFFEPDPDVPWAHPL
ncbi:MAG: hypothetical protein ACK5OX_11055 [Desertimonas sp.]